MQNTDWFKAEEHSGSKLSTLRFRGEERSGSEVSALRFRGEECPGLEERSAQVQS